MSSHSLCRHAGRERGRVTFGCTRATMQIEASTSAEMALAWHDINSCNAVLQNENCQCMRQTLRSGELTGGEEAVALVCMPAQCDLNP